MNKTDGKRQEGKKATSSQMHSNILQACSLRVFASSCPPPKHQTNFTLAAAVGTAASCDAQVSLQLYTVYTLWLARDVVRLKLQQLGMHALETLYCAK